MATAPSHVLVRNIPKDFRSSDLRRFFTEFVESDRVDCFHFRHRPEVKKASSSSSSDPSSSSGAEVTATDTRCGMVRFVDADEAARFLASYNGKHWTDEHGVEMGQRCIMNRVKVAVDQEGEEEEEKKEEGGGERPMKESDMSRMPELRPPAMMPKGNVGTPTGFFLDAIRQCRLPAGIIGKLKLQFPRARRRRKYGTVEYDYEEEEEGRRKRRRGRSRKKEEGDFLERGVHDVRNSAGPSVEVAKDESGSEDDDDTCEEWERHEALHDDVQARRAGNLGDDVSQQPGTKERLFEEEMEVTWDKGSSGLVFYTDAQVWKELEGDFDERTTDDWDVDMSVYYDDDGGAGDKDARDGLDARRAIFRRENKLEESAFKKRGTGGEDKTVRRTTAAGQPQRAGAKVGKFEDHTRGVGRRIMESQGWRDGRGLGPSSRQGMAEALENEGQVGKAGLGYYGEAISTFVAPKPKGRVRKTIRDVIISTAYDNPEETDPAEPVERTNPQMYLSHRKK